MERNNIQYIKFEFKDYGIGVPNEKKKYLFERSYAKNVSERGMGLGLSLVKKIIDIYEGEIRVEDRIKGDSKKGSNFIIMLREVL